MTAPAVSQYDEPTRFGRIRSPVEAWLAKQPPEPILEPELPIIDTHHHLWDRRDHRMGIGYAALWNAFKRIATGASADEKLALFSGTARRAYRLD